MKSPVVPSFILWRDLRIVPDSILIALVSYTVTISMSRLFAQKHKYNIDANQVPNKNNSFLFSLQMIKIKKHLKDLAAT